MYDVVIEVANRQAPWKGVAHATDCFSIYMMDEKLIHHQCDDKHLESAGCAWESYL
jgi:hypothetical protein